MWARNPKVVAGEFPKKKPLSAHCHRKLIRATLKAE
jgi:hypothetical protein